MQKAAGAPVRTIENLAIFSDVHGNSLALEAVLRDVDARGITRIYCLGDLVGYGADPNGVIDLIRTRGVRASSATMTKAWPGRRETAVASTRMRRLGGSAMHPMPTRWIR